MPQTHSYYLEHPSPSPPSLLPFFAQVWVASPRSAPVPCPPSPQPSPPDHFPSMDHFLIDCTTDLCVVDSMLSASHQLEWKLQKDRDVQLFCALLTRNACICAWP